MSKYQKRVHKEKSTIENIKDLLSIYKLLKKDKTTKDTPNIIFFDLCKAYDTVPRDLLIEKFQKFNLLCNISKLINDMLNESALYFSIEY